MCKRKDNVAKEPCCFPPRIPFFLQVVSDKHAFQSRVIGVSLIQAFLASCGTFFHYCTTSIERRTHPFHLTNPLWRSCTSFTIPTRPHCCLILHEWRWPHLHQTVLLTLHSANSSDSREYASIFFFLAILSLYLRFLTLWNQNGKKRINSDKKVLAIVRKKSELWDFFFFFLWLKQTKNVWNRTRIWVINLQLWKKWH